MIKIMEKKRLKTQSAILKSAHILIKKFGFEQTSMQSIAKKAEIATGTLYNYYPSKSALLIAIFDELTQELTSQFPKRSTKPFSEKSAKSDLENLMRHFCKFIYLFPKPIMRHLIGQMFMLELEEISELISLDMQIIGAIMPILADMQSANYLENEIDIEQVAILIYGSSTMQHQAYISIPNMSKQKLEQNISDQLEIIMYGIIAR